MALCIVRSRSSRPDSSDQYAACEVSTVCGARKIGCVKSIGSSSNTSIPAPRAFPPRVLGGGQLRVSLLRGSETRETVRGARPAARLEPCDKANPVVNGTSKVISLISLEPLGAPCIMFNSNGFYDSPTYPLQPHGKHGVSSPRKRQEVHFASSIEEVAGILVPC